MPAFLARYGQIPSTVKRLIAAQFLSNLVNGAMVLLLNLLLRNQGFSDPEIASCQSYRFLAILALALPVGLFLRGRRLKPFIIAACAVMPFASLGMLNAAESREPDLLAAYLAVWGVGMMTLQVSALPFLIRHTQDEHRAEAISLSFATWSLSLVSVGALVFVLTSVESAAAGATRLFDEAGLLRVFIYGSFGAVVLACTLKEKKPECDRSRSGTGHDWGRIIDTVIPNLAIAVGAGLTIPFMNLFFNSVFDLTAEEFSRLGGLTGFLVLVAALIVPAIRRRFGYRIAILATQSAAVAILLVLALTQMLHPGVPGMFWIACLCYLLRQPLMNMAGPATSELGMDYVGDRNREIVAALGATIWSGSWYISFKLFESLRRSGLEYWQIFLITAGLYGVGITLYWRLIRRHEAQARREPLPTSSCP